MTSKIQKTVVKTPVNSKKNPHRKLPEKPAAGIFVERKISGSACQEQGVITTYVVVLQGFKQACVYVAGAA